MKVSDLSGEALAYWVAHAEGYLTFKAGPGDRDNGLLWIMRHPDRSGPPRFISSQNQFTYWIAPGEEAFAYKPHISWEHGGPILDRMIAAGFGFTPLFNDVVKCSNYDDNGRNYLIMINPPLEMSTVGDTTLICACRAFVASIFGDEVPDGHTEE